jgi:hypothetical protein
MSDENIKLMLAAAAAFALGWFLSRGKPGPVPVEVVQPRDEPVLFSGQGYTSPNVNFQLSGDLSGLNVMGGEYVPLFGFVGTRAYY